MFVGGFLAAVDWREQWIVALMSLHLSVGAIAWITRRNLASQAILFTLIACAVRSAEYLNAFASLNWREFSSQNYFDSRGLFTSVVFSAPLLVVATFQWLNALASSTRLMIKVKRQEAKAHYSQSKGHAQEDAKKPL